MLPAGQYKTPAGSSLTISGPNGETKELFFAWFEEHACLACEPKAQDVDGFLVWHCDECGGWTAKLEPWTVDSDMYRRVDFYYYTWNVTK